MWKPRDGGREVSLGGGGRRAPRDVCPRRGAVYRQVRASLLGP